MENRSTKDSATIKSKLKKGTRVICRIDNNKWHTGTVSEIGECVRIQFDDGETATAADDELHFIKRLHTEIVSTNSFTTQQARELCLTEKQKLTRIRYNEQAEKEFALDLSSVQKPWPEFINAFRHVSSLVPFNELLLLDYRSPVHEYSLGMLSLTVDKMDAKSASSLITTAADAIARFAKVCGLQVQRGVDASHLAVSNPHMRQHLQIRLGAFKDNRAYVQVTPIK